MGSLSSQVKKQIEELISKMTVEEKVAQLGSIMPDELLEDDEFSEEKARAIMSNGIGQITRAGGASALHPKEAAKLANRIQKFLEEETRLGIPAMMHEECLSGYMGAGGTTYPQAIGLASTWQPELVQEITTEIRKQLNAVGAHHALSPVLDVAIDLRWGRVEETFGEDPYLVAAMATAYVTGLQETTPNEGGIYATVKHFGGHSYCEGGRNHAPVNLSPRVLRENFLFPFEVAIREGGAKAVMNAYHDIDGIPCACDRHMLTEILRGEWGFDGIVVSDYWSIPMLHTDHRVAGNRQQAGIMALEAGLDVELPQTECYGKLLVEAVKEGLVSEATIDQAVRRHLRAKFAKGLFDHRRYVDSESVNQYFETSGQRELARRAARQSLVLLKNEEDILPLSDDLNSIAVIGPNGNSTKNLLGDYAYSVHVESEDDTIPVVTLLEGIKNRVNEDTEVIYVEGCKARGEELNEIDQAVEVAKAADLVILAVGGKSGLGLVSPEKQKEAYPHTTGEGSDRTDLKLPGLQEELVQKVYNAGTPTVAVLINGRPLSISWIADNVPAILEAWLPGEEGGNALADILFGDYTPGGKLPVTIPINVGQLPIYYRRRKISKNRDYVFIPNKPLYPFGHGLSYTEFEYSNLKVEPGRIEDASEFQVSFKVENIGSVKGEEVVQLYIRDEYASLTRPERELKGFKRVFLEPGERKEVLFALSADQLAFYNEEMNLVVEPGLFKLMVGSSSEDIRLERQLEVIGNIKRVGTFRTYFTDVQIKEA